MFPSSVLKMIDEVTPKLNSILASGIAVEQMKHVEEYVDSIFRSAATGFPPGMKYLGCRRCTPDEEYNIVTKSSAKKKVNRCVFDVAISNVYLMEYKFSYLDELLPSRYLYLPFVNDAGVIYISGSRFVISPILSDRVISIGIANVFVRLLKAKLTFNRTPHHYVADGQRESIQVAWSSIYNEKHAYGAPKPTVKANCTLAHYLFCKYGVTETFQRFANCTPVIGGSEITNEQYPEDNWVLCTSSQISPKGYGKKFYEPSFITVAIPRDKYTAMVKNLLAGFFYCVDHFPTLIKPEPEYVESPRLWMILLGHIIWSGNVSHGKLFSDVDDHIASLDEYVDTIVKQKLNDIGFNCNDIYELFGLIINNFNEWLLSSDDRVNTSYNKELNILYYACYEISSSIFKLYFKLKAAQKKELNAKKIAKFMFIILKQGIIFRITRDHGEVTTTSSSGDNMALKTTLLLVPQSSSSRNRSKKDRLAITDPTKRLSASIAEVNSHIALPKSDPSGRSRLSLYLKISGSGLILRNEKYRKIIDDCQLMFKR